MHSDLAFPILTALVLTLFLRELPLRETSGLQESAREPTA